MLSPYKIDKKTLRTYLISRSFISKKASSILEVLERLKCIQVDPINVIARSHELSLWNRVENFSLKCLAEELYVKRNLFEYWMQLFSIIPIDYYPFLHVRRAIKGGWQEDYYKTHQKEIDSALSFIKKNGVTSAKDLLHIPKVVSLFSWSNDGSRTALLEYLWDTGKIMINHRIGNQKYYNLSEKVIDLKSLREVSDQECIDFLLKASFNYLGIVRKTFLGNRIGYIKNFGISEKIDDLYKKGDIIKLEIPGVKRDYFVLKEQLAEIEKVDNEHIGLNILPPLDPLIIDRKLIKDIFDFDYTWEAYTPASKRKFGYYGMPLLYNGAFVGQVELRKNKKAGIDVLKLEVSEKGKAFKNIFNSKLDSLSNLIENYN